MRETLAFPENIVAAFQLFNVNIKNKENVLPFMLGYVPCSNVQNIRNWMDNDPLYQLVVQSSKLHDQ